MDAYKTNLTKPELIDALTNLIDESIERKMNAKDKTHRARIERMQRLYEVVRDENAKLRAAVQNMMLSLGVGNVEQAKWTGEAILKEIE